ncbi:MAG: nucleotidyl transferase AbiEii/AbiGii toxin family protein [Akkermansiaceae bacterium]|nr:nucleotidyl transferase AbiEii/AbiGii toxin family protein [Akkermansiaceae bacterium]NNM28602.1 nucleotidyl transferase AbiEii/AbiGii toxin family protein [Akkermansiaceae bacterium]
MKNAAASVRARLLNHSRSTGSPFNAVLEQFAMGRFLWRLTQSFYRDRFVLKGAQLFRVWESELHRPTRDLDLLGFGDPSEEAIAAAFQSICELPSTPDDGLIWETVTVEPIRDDLEYGGVRAHLRATLAGARIPLQVDVGFGDAITPGSVESAWTELLDFPAASLLMYPPETVVAEKLEAAVSLGIRNSRMKDFFDLHWISGHMRFDRTTLARAVHATFERRGTAIPSEPPLALTAEFGNDPAKITQWNAFLRKSSITAPPFPEIISTLAPFLTPLLSATEDPTPKQWIPGVGWRERTEQP